MKVLLSKINKKYLKIFLAITTLISINKSSASNYFDTLKRKKIIISSLSSVYISNMGALYKLWYKDYEGSPFHFYDDSRHWMAMDKAGHAFSSFVESKFSYQMFKWAGYSHKKALILGCSYSFIYQNTFEIFDAYSAEWGFSIADVAANTFGSGLVLSQQLLWNENRILIKYSYQPSPFIKIRPETFGENFYQNLLKDYNGQTYWLNFNLKSLLNYSKIPDWLDVSIGYGANGMYGGKDNIYIKDGKTYNFNNTPRVYEIYLAPDINLERLHIEKKWLKIALNILNSYKVPLPALKYTQNRSLKFIPIMF
ncbi:MAG: DUF2279 domain-containing protein [Bacteroidetes bacterium]|nr:DUF2279 domain-containing protein [Bacteroidota bacterium]